MASRRFLLLVVATLCGACGSEHPTAPDAVTPSPRPTSSATSSTPQAVPSSLLTFSVSGRIVDEAGRPMSGVQVVMRYAKPECCRTITVLTDGAGRYAVTFEASPNPYSVRAEIMVDGYDWHYRDIPASNAPIVADFRLQRVVRIAAGEAVEVALARENGDCLGFHYPPCARLRVTVPADGELTLGTADGGGLQDVAITACCVNGDERGGNPFTMPVTAGDEVWVEVGRSRAMSTVEGRVRVATSFTPR